MSIKVSHLTKLFGTQTAVDDVSFQVEKGEILGFLGPNGAGKTTTMRMISGYLTADEGEILVNGTPVTEESTKIRSNLGYLPENNPLYQDMYVREYLRYVARIYHIDQPWKRINEVIEMTGLTKEYHKQIRELSKGYRQRVGLAQAIIHNPDVLILDEATSGLDPNQLIEIRQLIKDLGKEKTILLSTHIMQEVQALCDRVIIINKGKIVADGNIRLLSQNLTNAYKVNVIFSRHVVDITLREIEGYISHEEINSSSYIITGKENNLNEAIFDFAVKKGLKIIEMSTLQESVENIFQQLTQAS
ncbi:MAG: ATP-binding cassette domain-containing protein [Saprospiraceae bacterium]|uniref:ATP-binding cassette domain-containing protein n=1 Tax=Candidatus Opimibacter skivensis TaxID=2982028 RepID=A0A9D7SUK7_9BACT|nr:ATP-binding cassette domain-containing protein [Candidatus Opimibacter skivensis]